jgi:tRNA-Thr(GGU) m(6)t(6)A37 methyltransferase TsaA
MDSSYSTWGYALIAPLAAALVLAVHLHQECATLRCRLDRAEKNCARVQKEGKQMPSTNQTAQNSEWWHNLSQPIGYVRSCFIDVCVTPRQPSLAPDARAVLQLDKSISPTTLEGLDAHSHVWVLFIFHKNQNAAKLQTRGYSYKSKIHVPRCSTGKVGCLSTRSPHRPNPIGLSLAKIEEVRVAERQVWLSGSDLVDGSPILDIKPYVPAYDYPVLRGDGPCRVPYFSDQQSFEVRAVAFEPAVLQAFNSGSGVMSSLRVFKGEPQRALTALTQVLGADVSRKESGRNPLRPYHLLFDGLDVEYTVEGAEEKYATLVHSVSRQPANSQSRSM